MLEFASLFLGLVWGSQHVEMVVGDPQVAKLEFRLDGKPAATLESPPWKTNVDFGLLAPHRLQVIGFAAGGDELARAEQWINVPRPQSEARLVIEQDAQGRKTHGRLSWESVSGEAPRSVEISFDGKVLDVPDAHRFPLPAASPDALHFLSADVVFPDETTAHAEATFGGPYGDQVETELTAFVVRKEKRGAKSEALRSCFTNRGGEEVRVAAVERGAIELLVVRDRGAEKLLENLRVAGPYKAGVPNAGNQAPNIIDGVDYGHVLRFDMKLEKPDRVRLVWPFLQGGASAAADRGLFESSPIFTSELGGFYFFMTQFYPPSSDGDQHLADALALAGLRAAAEGRRRAVVLLLGENKPEEKSALAPAEVQAFLEKLQVPLFVWSATPRKLAGEAWPPSPSVATMPLLNAAFRKLQAELERQTVVWLAGRHLASEIRFDSAKCAGFELLLTASAEL